MFNETHLIILSIIFLILFLLIIFVFRKKRSTGEDKGSDLVIELSKTRSGFVNRIGQLLKLRSQLNEEFLGDLEQILIEADIGYVTTSWLMNELRIRIKEKKITQTENIRWEIEDLLRTLLRKDYQTDRGLNFPDTKPIVILFTGVNGVGKTTTIGKLAKKFRDQSKKVLLIAGDTFRAAAGEQLAIWAERSGVMIHKQKSGADPSSVVYDGINLALNQGMDYVLIDTAGRQHTKVNLMKELEKIKRTIKKLIPDAPHETLLVLDATTGQNALTQAERFQAAIGLSGIVICKLDGSAKGGIIIGIKQRLELPVKLIGVGEKPEDLREFEVDKFVDALFVDQKKG